MFDDESIKWLDGFIERQREREDFDLESGAGLSSKIGCFLGEALCANFKCRWEQTEYGLGVVFPNGNAAFPLAKTDKHFANGAEDSIYSFYETAKVALAEPLM